MGNNSPPSENEQTPEKKDAKDEKNEEFLMPDFAYYIEGMCYFDDDD